MEETEEGVTSGELVTPEDTEKTKDLTENTEQEGPITKGRAAEYAGITVVSEGDVEILYSGIWYGMEWSLDANGKLILNGNADYGILGGTSTPWYNNY